MKSIINMVGKAKANQDAELMTPPLCGNSLRGRGAFHNKSAACAFVRTFAGPRTHWLIWPSRTRLGPVPVSVAMPPMLAA